MALDQDFKDEQRVTRDWIDSVLASIHPECVLTRYELVRRLQMQVNAIQFELQMDEIMRQIIGSQPRGRDPHLRRALARAVEEGQARVDRELRDYSVPRSRATVPTRI